MKTIAIASLILAVSFSAVSLSHFPQSPLAFLLMFVVASSIGVSLKQLGDDRSNAG
jgi:hypothetical protein